MPNPSRETKLSGEDADREILIFPNAIGTELLDLINSGLSQWRMGV